MAKEWHIKKRRPVRRKQIAPLLKELEFALGIDLAVDGAFLEMAQYGPWQMVFVDKIAKSVELTNDDGKRFAFLTLRGFLEHSDSAKWVNVDHGAIPFLMNGADCMVAGIQDADPSIEVGDLVWIRDMKHKRPLAIGWTTMDSSELIASSKGKGIKTLHWVGDELWDMDS
jgi:predicted RNA-binding protein (TIGR00451 family)